MTAVAGQRIVRCPICMDRFTWPDDDFVYLYSSRRREHLLVDVAELEPEKRADYVRRGYQRCLGQSGDTDEHYLPASYADYGEPLVVGLVGAPRSGKTHLLTAMLREVFRERLQDYGTSAVALDFRRHEEFVRDHIDRFENGKPLDGTGRNVSVYSDSVLVGSGPDRRPVTFFDVAGEDLLSTDVRGRGGRFLAGADALVFVHAADDVRPGPDGAPNPAFAMAMERIRSYRDPTDLPVVVVVTKADRLRYVPPADRWMTSRAPAALDPARILDETRDVYAYLRSTGATGALAPFRTFRRCTMHFASASGGDVSDSEGVFPRGIRPARVLEPFVALLAMTGVLSTPGANEVGVL